jgi:predicted nucleotidyltransferase component of viral defense system
MKTHLASLIQVRSEAHFQRNIAREYLQARILACLQRSGAMSPLAFHGGTALRFLYNIPRYSEDLDFTLERHPNTQYNFRAYLRAIQSELKAEGYEVEFRVNDQKVVHSAFIRFKGLLYELGLSPHQCELFSIKLEVDTNPPAGVGLTTTIVRRHVTVQLQHHDRASLLAGKLHAILQRSYTKGRDIYDLVWYLSDPNWPAPNLTLLNNALQQTGWQEATFTESNWRDIVAQHIQMLDWSRVMSDVSPFLELADEIHLLTEKNLLQLLE